MRLYTYVVLLLLVVVTSGCATPQLSELQEAAPNERFAVQAELECLYRNGVEHVSSYLGMSEPRFTWYVDDQAQYAWFRQPLTLVELEAVSDKKTEVRRSQTGSANAFGQGDDLIAFLKRNPCAAH